MKTIIAPTDFSNVSVNALNYAADLALTLNANLLLLHANELPFAIPEAPLTGLIYNEIDTEEELLKLKTELLARTNYKIKVDAKQVTGTIENELIKMCDYREPFAVVMGTHGKGVVESVFIESTTVYLAKHFKYPVMVIPEDVSFRPIKKVALASDMKNIYDLPFDQIKLLVETFNASLDVVHVDKTGKGGARHFIRISLLSHYLRDLKPHFHFVKSDDTEKGVSRFAEENNIDVVLVQPKKHGLFHRSDSRRFIFYSPVPVVAIHEK